MLQLNSSDNSCVTPIFENKPTSCETEWGTVRAEVLDPVEVTDTALATGSVEERERSPATLA